MLKNSNWKLTWNDLDNEGNLYSWGVDSTYSQSTIPNLQNTNVLDVDCGDDHTVIVKIMENV